MLPQKAPFTIIVFATINADSFNVLAGDSFYNGGGFYTYSATISASDFNVTAGYSFYNRDGATMIVKGAFNCY